MSTCFYCGGHHETGNCISVAVDRASSTISTTIEDIGHRSLDQLDQLAEYWGQAQYEITSAIEDVAAAVDEATAAVEEVAGVVQEFYDFSKSAHDEAMWRAEKQIQLLTGIRDILKNPRGTQANELYVMALDSFRRHRFNDALQLLTDAGELNPGDYRIHVTLGHIFVQRNEFPKARESFRSAADYARTNRYKVRALLLLSRAVHCAGLIQEQLAVLKEAYNIWPNDSRVCYELALSLNSNGHRRAAEAMMEKAISGNRNLFVRAKLERVFPNLLAKLFQKAQAQAKIAIRAGESATDDMGEWAEADTACEGLADIHSSMSNWLDKAERAAATQSYFGYLDVIQPVNAAVEKFTGTLQQHRSHIFDYVIPNLSEALRLLSEEAPEIKSFLEYEEAEKRLRLAQEHPEFTYEDIAGGRLVTIDALNATMALIDRIQDLATHGTQRTIERTIERTIVRRELRHLPPKNWLDKLLHRERTIEVEVRIPKQEVVVESETYFLPWINRLQPKVLATAHAFMLLEPYILRNKAFPKNVPLEEIVGKKLDWDEMLLDKGIILLPSMEGIDEQITRMPILVLRRRILQLRKRQIKALETIAGDNSSSSV